MGYGGAVTYGAFGEHVRFAFQLAVLVYDFKGAKQIVGSVFGKSIGISACVDQPKPRRKAVISAV